MQEPGLSTASYQTRLQVVDLDTKSQLSQVYHNYNSRLSIVLGVTNIILVTIAIVLNAVAFVIQVHRKYDSLGHITFIMFPAAFCGLFIYLAAALAIASDVRRTRPLIIAHLVLAIIGCCFVIIFLGFSGAALDYELSESIYTYNTTPVLRAPLRL